MFTKARIVLFIIAVTLMTANIILFARTVVLSDQITKMEGQTSAITLQNQQLRQKLYSLQSLSNVEQYAEDLGFTGKAQALNLGPQQVAMNR